MTATMGLLPGVDAAAVISDDEQYRYSLHRRWGDERGILCWIMLNPSTASAETDDPTIRKCQKFARAWGYDEIVVVNLFALRSTDPVALLAHPDPVGPDNDVAIRRAVHSCNGMVVAWGQSLLVLTRPRATAVQKLVREERPRLELLALRITKHGRPWHPLYVPDATAPIVYR